MAATPERRLLRSLWAGGGHQPHLALANIRHLEATGYAPTCPEDRPIIEATLAYARKHGEAPTETDLRLHLEPGDRDVLDRFESAALARDPAKAGGFASLVEAIQDGQRDARDIRIRSRALQIAQHGVRVPLQRPKPDAPEAEWWPAEEAFWGFFVRGPRDAAKWEASARAHFSDVLKGGATQRDDFVPLSSLEAEPVAWLWTGRIPRGELTLIEGPSGSGKTTVARAIAAAITRGDALPDEDIVSVQPRGVVWLSSEESLARVLRPNLEYAGADLDRVFVFSASEDEMGGAWTTARLGELARFVDARGVDLVVIDQIKDHVRISNDWHEGDVRKAVAPLVRWAHETGVAVVGIRHWRKGGGAATDRGAGSVAWYALARSVLSVAQQAGHRYVAHAKAGLAAVQPTIEIEIEQADRGTGRSKQTLARVAWRGEAEGVTADDLATATAEDAETRTAREEAEQWLLLELAGGPVRSTDLVTAAKRAGIAERTLSRARRAVAAAYREEGQWWTRLREPPARAEIDLDADAPPAPSPPPPPPPKETNTMPKTPTPPPLSIVPQTETLSLPGGHEIRYDRSRSVAKTPEGYLARPIMTVDGRPHEGWVAEDAQGRIMIDDTTARLVGATA